MRCVTYTLTGVPTKGFLPFKSDSYAWFTRAGCKIPWFFQHKGGWRKEFLYFGVSEADAKKIAKLVEASAKLVEAKVKELPSGFQALVRWLEDEDDKKVDKKAAERAENETKKGSTQGGDEKRKKKR